MFEVNVKNVMEGWRNAAWVWGSDHKFGWVGGGRGGGGVIQNITTDILGAGGGGLLMP